MIGAIIGDIIGSIYEFSSGKTKDFPLFDKKCHPTDDSILTVAVGCTCILADCKDENSFKSTLRTMLKGLARQYPRAGFGYMFYMWMIKKDNEPYGSYGNGSAMRVSPVAWTMDKLEDVERVAQWSAEVTHNHQEGIKGAKAIAAATFLARKGKSKEEIKKYIEDNYYKLDFTLDEIRPTYVADVTCEGSVPQAIVCFLEATDYEDAIRNAISLGGDGDTIGAMAGSIAEAYFGVDEKLKQKAMSLMDQNLLDYYHNYADILYEGPLY